jgi:hypothetical protein
MQVIYLISKAEVRVCVYIYPSKKLFQGIGSLKRRNFLQFVIISVLFSPESILAAVNRITAEKKKKKYHQFTVHSIKFSGTDYLPACDGHIKDYLAKIRFPDRPNRDDIILSRREFLLLGRVVKRFERVRSITGHGNFCVIGFDEALRIGRLYSKVGRFTSSELDFLEMIYFRDAEHYGFKGEKQVVTLTRTIKRKDILKVPYSGNYLYKGPSHEKYERVKRELGEKLVLTSGIRGVTKQFYLFLNKAFRHGGNLSLASRSLAPPGYSYHATGDFDVGQKGFGGANFSERFTTTSVFKELADRGLVQYRYKRDNLLGVRYEPWHIKLNPESVTDTG